MARPAVQLRRYHFNWTFCPSLTSKTANKADGQGESSHVRCVIIHLSDNVHLHQRFACGIVVFLSKLGYCNGQCHSSPLYHGLSDSALPGSDRLCSQALPLVVSLRHCAIGLLPASINHTIASHVVMKYISNRLVRSKDAFISDSSTGIDPEESSDERPIDAQRLYGVARISRTG